MVYVPTQVKLQGQSCLPALAGNVWARGFPFPPAGVPCSPSLFVEGVLGSKGQSVDFRPGERGVAAVWVNKALKPVLSLQQEFQGRGIRS